MGRIGFFGPSGTFTEEAASLVGEDLIAFDSILDVLRRSTEGGGGCWCGAN